MVATIAEMRVVPGDGWKNDLHVLREGMSTSKKSAGNISNLDEEIELRLCLYRLVGHNVLSTCYTY
jgi:hypothetical protein